MRDMMWDEEAEKWHASLVYETTRYHVLPRHKGFRQTNRERNVKSKAFFQVRGDEERILTYDYLSLVLIEYSAGLTARQRGIEVRLFAV
jgi:hypothetical protein